VTDDDDDMTQRETNDVTMQQHNTDCCNSLRSSLNAGSAQQQAGGLGTKPVATTRGSTVRGSNSAAVNELSAINCRLEPSDLWNRFHELGTEMIITKSGRFVAV